MEYTPSPRIFKDDLKEHLYFKGFFQHPKFSDIYSSKDGITLDISRMYFSNNECNGRYASITIDGVSYRKHAIVLETFLEVPEEFRDQKVVVNHINGNPGDNNLENLEWITYAGNSRHAYESGLRKDNTPILVKDLRTNYIQRFHSLQACARFFNCNGARISYCLRPNRIGLPHFGFYVLIREGQEWPSTDITAVSKLRDAEVKETVAYCTVNKTFTIYATQNQASEETGIHRKRIREHLRKAHSAGKGQVKIDEFIFMRMHDFVLGNFNIPGSDKTKVTKAEYVQSRKPKGIGFRKPLRLKVTDLETGDVKEYESSRVFAKLHGTTRSNLQNMLWVNSGIWKKKFRVEYIPEEFPKKSSSLTE